MDGLQYPVTSERPLAPDGGPALVEEGPELVLLEDPPPLPPPAEWEPPVAPPPVDDAHIFLWLTRTNRQATCQSCRAHIESGSFRIVYDPHPSRLPANRRWSAVLYTYFHVNRACIVDLATDLRADHAGRRGSSSSSATFLESQGWALQVDVAPLPAKAKESLADRRAKTSDAIAQVNGEFAAVSMLW